MVGGNFVATAGSPVSIPLEALDAHGNLATSFAGRATLKLQESSACRLSRVQSPPESQPTFTLGRAVAEFTNMFAESCKAYLLAGDGVDVAARTVTLTWTPGTPVSYRINTELSDVGISVDASANIVLELVDTYGNVAENQVGSYQGRVSFTPATAAISPGNLVYFSAGYSTVTATHRLPSPVTLSLPSISLGGLTAIPGTHIVDFQPGAAVELVFNTTHDVVVGSDMSLVVYARDQYNNLATHLPTVTIKVVVFSGTEVELDPPSGAMIMTSGIGSMKATSRIAHSATFRMLDAPQSLTYTDTVTATFLVGPPAKLESVRSDGDGPVSVDNTLRLVVKLQDSFGNVVTSATGWIFTARIVNGMSTAFTLVSGLGGAILEHTRAETVQVEVEDTNGYGVVMDTPIAVLFTHGQAVQLRVSLNATRSSVDIPVVATVSCLDRYGNLAISYDAAATVEWDVSGSGVPRDPYAVFSHGRASTLITADRLNASPSESVVVSLRLSGQSTGLTVQSKLLEWTVGSARTIWLTGGASTTVGLDMNIELQIKDQYGNSLPSLDQSYTVCLSVAIPGLLERERCITMSSSIASLSISSFRAGRFLLSLSSVSPNTLVLASEKEVIFLPIAAAQCAANRNAIGCIAVLELSASSSKVDDSVLVTITVKDPHENVVTDYSGQMVVEVARGIEVSLSTSGIVQLNGGIGSCSVSTKLPQSGVKVQLLDTFITNLLIDGLGYLTLDFLPGDAFKYQLSSAVSSQVVSATATITVSVKAFDQFGNSPPATLPAGENNVQIYTISGSILPLTATVKLTVQGSAEADFLSTKAGSVTLGLKESTSSHTIDLRSTLSLLFLPGPLAQWQIKGPKIELVGRIAQIVISAYDSFGNAVTDVREPDYIFVAIKTVLASSSNVTETTEQSLVMGGQATTEITVPEPAAVELTARHPSTSTKSETFVINFRFDLTPPELSVSRGNIASTSVEVQYLTTEAGFVLCTALDRDGYEAFTTATNEVKWRQMLDGSGKKVGIADGVELVGSLRITGLTPETTYVVLCYAGDEQNPPNLSTKEDIIANEFSFQTLQKLETTADLSEGEYFCSPNCATWLGISIPLVAVLLVVAFLIFRQKQKLALSFEKREGRFRLGQVDDELQEHRMPAALIGTEPNSEAEGDTSDNVFAKAAEMQKMIMNQLMNTVHSIQSQCDEAIDTVMEKAAALQDELALAIEDNEDDNSIDKKLRRSASQLYEDLDSILYNMGGLDFGKTQDLGGLQRTVCHSDYKELDGTDAEAEQILLQRLEELEQKLASYSEVVEKEHLSLLRGMREKHASRLEESRELGTTLQMIVNRKHKLLIEQAAQVSDLLGAHGQEIRHAEDEHLRELQEQELGLLAKQKDQREIIFEKFRAKIGSTDDELERQKLLREGMEMMTEVDRNIAAERRDLQERLRQRAKARAAGRKSKHDHELEELLAKHRAEVDALRGQIRDLQKQLREKKDDMFKEITEVIGEHVCGDVAFNASHITGEVSSREAAKAWDKEKAERIESIERGHERRLKVIRDGDDLEAIMKEYESAVLNAENDMEAEKIAQQKANRERLKARRERREALIEKRRKAEEALEDIGVDFDSAEAELVQKYMEGGLGAEQESRKFLDQLEQVKTKVVAELGRHSEGQLAVVARFANKEARDLRTLHRREQDKLSVHYRQTKEAAAQNVTEVLGEMEEEEQRSGHNLLASRLDVLMEKEISRIHTSRSLDCIEGGDINQQLQAVLERSDNLAREQKIRGAYSKLRRAVEKSARERLESDRAHQAEEQIIRGELLAVEEEERKLRREAIESVVQTHMSTASQIVDYMDTGSGSSRLPPVFDASITEAERHKLLEEHELRRAEIENRISDNREAQKHALQQRLAARRKRLENKKEQILQDAGTRSRINAHLHRAIGALGAHRRLDKSHAEEMEEMANRHRAREEEVTSRLEEEARREKEAIEARYKAQMEELEAKLRKALRKAGNPRDTVRVAPEEMAAVREDHQKAMTAAAQELEEEKRVQELIMQKKIAEREARIKKSKERVKKKHRQEQVLAELSYEQSKLQKSSGGRGQANVAQLVSSLNKVNALMRILNTDSEESVSQTARRFTTVDPAMMPTSPRSSRPDPPSAPPFVEPARAV
ncbi:hypothetical protein FOL47_003342 [Perkinsus chesapeaki]|uniref:Uncharacterized protein n=1 Tax=Perkinsus chesapeaki TaxID=330153 RepID=A0A7J6M8I8_PERCH|nr:hypothetical protein FOL47_003342 [Perkinsus chesapeaki]